MKQGVVFDIQHYAMHDGPGIRTIVFMKGCPLKCVWCCNPESQSSAPELRHTTFRCHACYSCQQACPKEAIKAIGGMPFFDRAACRGCDVPCVEACPQGALSLVGEWMTSGQVLARVAADKAFYDNSGGGVTFSGGEPFAQPAFLEELLTRSKQLGIRTAIETCGHADPRVVVRCEPFIDLFFYDLKIMDSWRHERLTGIQNSVILENLRTLAAKAPVKLVVRVPVVPGCTNDAANLEAMAFFLGSIGIAKIELMPYHTLGADKYASFGRKYRVDEDQSLSPGTIADVVRVFSLSGIACGLGEEQ